MDKKRVYSFLQISVLLIGTIAFCWILGDEVRFVSSTPEEVYSTGLRISSESVFPGLGMGYASNIQRSFDSERVSFRKLLSDISAIPKGLYYNSTGSGDNFYLAKDGKIYLATYDFEKEKFKVGKTINEVEIEPLISKEIFSKDNLVSSKALEEMRASGIVNIEGSRNTATGWENTISALNFANIVTPIAFTIANSIWIQSGEYSTEFKEAWSDMLQVIDWTAAGNQAVQKLTTEFMKNKELASTFNTAMTLITSAVIILSFVSVFSREGKGYVVVEYECQPWQAPSVANCDACNDGDLPCNIYKCKSLGQTCELVNEGYDGSEICVENNTRDTTFAQIFPNETYLTQGYVYSDYNPNPPSPGFRIMSDEDEWQSERSSELESMPENGSIKAFDPLTFAISTEEVTRCKIDTDRTKTYDEMFAYVGGSSLLKKTHIEKLILPNQDKFNSSGIELSAGDLELYIICEDISGNKNLIPYTIRMKIDPAPDTSPPIIRASTILTDSCVANGEENVSVSFYIHEPVDGCKWDYANDAYGSMKNEMDCYGANGVDYLAICNATFLGIKAAGTNYYVKCNDTSGNVMRDPEVFSIRSSPELSLKITSPKNGSSIYGSINTLQVVLSAQTGFGCNSGLATCAYLQNGQWIEFAETNKQNGVHKQELYLPGGDYTYSVKCIDGGGNVVSENVSFGVETTSGVIISGFEIEGSTINFRTYAPSDCAYSVENCDFTFEQGTLIPPSNSMEHYFNYEEDKTYFIKCMDEYNMEPADCTIKIKPDDFL